VLALQGHLFCYGDAAALFLHLAAESKVALLRLDYGTEDVIVGYFDDYLWLCNKLAVVEDVCAHQHVDQLLGSAVTPREAHTTPSAFRTVERA